MRLPLPPSSLRRAAKRAMPLLSLAVLLHGCGGADSANDSPANSLAPERQISAATLNGTVTALHTEVARQQTATASVRQALFGLNPGGTANATSLSGLSWNPTHDSSYWTVLDSSRNQVVMRSNWSYGNAAAGSQRVLAVTGTHPATLGRYAAFGGNPLGVPGNAAMDKLMLNTIGWLTQQASPANLKVVTAHLPGTETYWFPHEAKVRTWLAANIPGVVINGQASATQADNLCDGAQLDACLQGAHLLVIGREQGPGTYDGAAVMNAVTAAQMRGIPVLYLHHYRDTNDLADRLLGYFALAQANNYWTTDGLSAYDPASEPPLSAELAAIDGLVTRLAQGSFSTTWSGCVSSFGRVGCSGDALYQSEFAQPAATVRARLLAMDQRGVKLPSEPGYTLEKLLVQLGDKYRANVSYPLNKSQDTQAFLRAYFSDKTVYLHRTSTAVAQNLGNYATPIPADTPTIGRWVQVPLPSTGTRDHLTGLYVLPGRPFQLKRTDAGTGQVRVGIHLLRDTTWLFNTYDRPTDISSPRFVLPPGEVVTLTSPYGGPLLLFVDAAASGVQTATVGVQGVITHPVLRDPTQAAQITAFAAELASTPTQWVAVTTDTLTLHSTLANFKQTMAAYGNDLAQLASDTWRYTVRDTYELAGFNAASGKLRQTAAVAAFCTAHGWDCTGTQHRREVMQHVVSDAHAACGSGCSGNPYDQDWAFTPLGWGETHEIGHNLQVGRLKIYGGQSGEVSNNLFPMHKQMVFNQSAAGQASPIVARNGAGLKAFTALKTALASTTPVESARSLIWGDTAYAANNTERVMFYRQLSEFARYYNGAQLGNGWDLHTLMYLLHRNLDANKANWSAVAASYGLGSYASAPTDGNDFMLMASSYIIGRDMRPVFDLWGITRSAAADAQVTAYGYAAAKPLFFPMSHLAQPASAVGKPIVMSASATYPAGY